MSHSSTSELNKEIYTDPGTGRAYEVACWIDMDSPPPGGNPLDDVSHGIVLRLSYDPTDPEEIAEWEGNLTTEFVMSAPLMRKLNTSYRGSIGMYYDFIASLNRAINVWGCKPEYAEKAVEEDYKYLQGWYDDKWYWIGITVRRADKDDPWHDTPLSISGFESLILDDDEAKRKIIEEMVFSLEHDIRHEESKGQLSLPLVV